ncbi:MAG: alpha/beta hydrolase [Phycisphaerales bacterium]|nr:alpha/beta hydrolase [Phycisphaerales bacterium]
MHVLRCLLLPLVLAMPALASEPSTDTIGELTTWLAIPADTRPTVAEQSFASTPLTRDQAAQVQDLLWKDRQFRLLAERKPEWEAKSITAAGKTMKFDYRLFGEPPQGGRSMFISMHGGGNAPPEVNERQWKNQLDLYTPTEGIYIAPRAPTDTWNLWHEPHIDPLFDRLIEDAILFENVNPDRVYLLGYSAGGDGVYQIAPRMADRFAAAAMMAGHPNEASPLNLRNLPFVINMGADDKAYNRNTVAAEWGKKLGELRANDPGGYIYEVHLREGLGHWMKKEDASAIPWMMNLTRDPLPDRVVWRQDDVTQPRLYWLAMPEDQRKAGAMVTVKREGQVFTVEAVEGPTAITILLNDRMCDLDLPVRVERDGRAVFEGKVDRTVELIAASLDHRADAMLVFSAQAAIQLPSEAAAPATQVR